MKLWNRIKFTLLQWLLDDICERSECEKCRLYHEDIVCGARCFSCVEGDIFHQACKAWEMEDAE